MSSKEMSLFSNDTPNNEESKDVETNSQEILDNILMELNTNKLDPPENDIENTVKGKTNQITKPSVNIQNKCKENFIDSSEDNEISSQELLDNLLEINNKTSIVKNKLSHDNIENLGDNSVENFKEHDDNSSSNNLSANKETTDETMENIEISIENEKNHKEDSTENEPIDNSMNDDTQIDFLSNSTEEIDDSQNKNKTKSRAAPVKKLNLPLSRVKLIMKTDPEVKIISSDASVLVGIAAEHFLKFIINETARITKANKKKTMMKHHFDEAIRGLEVTEFLEGMMD